MEWIYRLPQNLLILRQAIAKYMFGTSFSFFTESPLPYPQFLYERAGGRAGGRAFVRWYHNQFASKGFRFLRQMETLLRWRAAQKFVGKSARVFSKSVHGETTLTKPSFFPSLSFQNGPFYLESNKTECDRSSVRKRNEVNCFLEQVEFM